MGRVLKRQFLIFQDLPQIRTVENFIPVTVCEGTMKLGTLVRQTLEKQGIVTLKAASKKVGVSVECLRQFLGMGYIPKDSTLRKIAKSLELDQDLVILAAHRERLSGDGEYDFLVPIDSGYEKKRVWPLSQEQCRYLEKIMCQPEIQLLRKYRQLSAEGQDQIIGYVGFVFSTHRSKPPSESVPGSPCGSLSGLAGDEAGI